VSPASGVAQDFTNPVTYTVTAEDGVTTQDWVVTVSTALSEIDKSALIALYNSTDGPNWTNTWNLNDPIDTWYGVTVTSGRVTALELIDNQLNGSLPTELNKLDNCNVLNLAVNQLSGSIPQELGSMLNLTVLSLHTNELSGSIPLEFGNLINLTSLQYYANNIEGGIPSVFGNLTNLRILQIGNNPMGGSIPIELGNLSNLTHLSIQGSLLSGTIPMELGNLSMLRELSLGYNQLNGNIPTELGNMVSLEVLGLHDNELSGNLPELPNLTALDYILLQNNSDLSGSLPSSLISITPITFYFNNTKLCEPVDADYQAWKTSVVNYLPSGLLCNETEITSFTFTEQTQSANIGSGTIEIEVEYGTDVTSLTPTITLSGNATVDPLSGVAQDFTNPVTYTVTAEAGFYQPSNLYGHS
jgi:Leucine-rich repeat (LRR) protein